ncbi:ABC transporter permease [Streptomyces sp. P6-2-1]|uniref:ABC transporter permease n=1 Tax=unclassified Streptomyces TaxID=2593676 RepID=UPI003D3611AB
MAVTKALPGIRASGSTHGSPEAPPAAKPSRAARLRDFFGRARRDSPLLLMVAPAVLLLAAFTYLPLLGSAVAFMDYSPGLPSTWVGFANFQALFQDDAFWQAVSNTFQITFFQLLFYFPVPILLAVLFNAVAMPMARKFTQSVIYLPHFLSWVIIVALFQQVLGGGGVINRFLSEHGHHGVNVMADPGTFKLLLTAQSVWKDAGWGTIIFLAAIAAIDTQLYESATMDGAGAWGRFWHVTLPGMRPIIVLMLILRLGDALTVGFEQVLLQRDAVGPEAAEVLDTYVYFNGVVDGNWGLATAAGLLKGVVSLLLVLGANSLAHRLGEEGVYQR